MALVISRTAGTAFYLGQNMDPDRLDETCDCRVRVQEIGEDDWWANPRVVVQVSRRNGEVFSSWDHILCGDFPELDLGMQDTYHEVASIRLGGVRNEDVPGRSKHALLASIGIRAPRSVQILRDNAKQKELVLR